jgi:hypothetical protein
MDVRLLRALEVFSRAMAARDRRLARETGAETGEVVDDDDDDVVVVVVAVVVAVVGVVAVVEDDGGEEDWISGDVVLSLDFDGREAWLGRDCDGDWRWCWRARDSGGGSGRGRV